MGRGGAGQIAPSACHNGEAETGKGPRVGESDGTVGDEL